MKFLVSEPKQKRLIGEEKGAEVRMFEEGGGWKSLLKQRDLEKYACQSFNPDICIHISSAVIDGK
jgi:hypothetical protein